MSPTTPTVRQPARRGRPRVRGVKRWHGEAVARVVRDALAARDVDDLGVGHGSDVSPCVRRSQPFAAVRYRRLRDPAPAPPRGHRDDPPRSCRVVHQLNGRITDRLARSLATRSDISEFIWA